MLERIATYFSVNGAVEHVLHLLQTEGETGLDGVRTILNGITAFTARDMVGVWDAMNKEKADVTEIVAAVKAEFNLQ